MDVHAKQGRGQNVCCLTWAVLSLSANNASAPLLLKKNNVKDINDGKQT